MTDIKTSDIRAHIKRYAHANDRLAVWALAQTTLGQLVALLLYGVDQIAIAVVLEAGILCRTFVIFHDGIHYSYFRRRQANQKLATLLQAWVITPINHWQRNHFHHHRYFGNLDIQDHADTVFFTRQQYESFPPGKRRLARFLRDPVVFFLLAPIAQWWIEYPFLKGNRYVWLGHTVHLLIAWQLSWWHLSAIYLSGILALMLFHLQHAGIADGADAVIMRRGDRTGQPRHRSRVEKQRGGGKIGGVCAAGLVGDHLGRGRHHAPDRPEGGDQPCQVIARVLQRAAGAKLVLGRPGRAAFADPTAMAGLRHKTVVKLGIDQPHRAGGAAANLPESRFRTVM